MVKEGDYEEAIKDFTEAIKIKPGYATAYFNRGNAWMGLGEYRNALKDFKKAIELDPKKREKASEKIKFCEFKIKDK
jgi:tetratricopeptide (TPR) repeat protein